MPFFSSYILHIFSLCLSKCYQLLWQVSLFICPSIPPGKFQDSVKKQTPKSLSRIFQTSDYMLNNATDIVPLWNISMNHNNSNREQKVTQKTISIGHLLETYNYKKINTSWASAGITIMRHILWFKELNFYDYRSLCDLCYKCSNIIHVPNK